MSAILLSGLQVLLLYFNFNLIDGQVYSPQKGASKEDQRYLEKGMIHVAQLFKELKGKDISSYPGAGAAGFKVFS